MTSADCIAIIRDGLIRIIDSCEINGTYNQSKSSISFYVNDINVSERPLLTLRLSNHRPTYSKYIHSSLTPPSNENFTNLSIEFYKPIADTTGRTKKNRVRPNINTPEAMKDVVLPFTINSFSYKPSLLDLNDVKAIYASILNWINNSTNESYLDPLAGTPKQAKEVSKTARIKVKRDICQAEINFYKRYGLGDCISRPNGTIVENKQIIRITESDLHKMIKESVRLILEEKNSLVNDKVGDYEVVYGNLLRQKLRDCPEMGGVEDVCLYSNVKNGGKTYALYRIYNTQKYFFAEWIPLQNSNKTVAKKIKVNEVPKTILNHAHSLIHWD